MYSQKIKSGIITEGFIQFKVIGSTKNAIRDLKELSMIKTTKFPRIDYFYEALLMLSLGSELCEKLPLEIDECFIKP